jgi:EmrB/QacA subfamily drug resistance transporter
MQLAYKWRAAIVCALGLFMAVLDNTIVNVALPPMMTYFHTDQTTITWVITGYFLSQAAVIPVVGYLSDRFGEKRIFLIALASFTFGSALCAIAPNEGTLIAFRVFQGIGGGALFPLGFAITFRVFPPEERGPASAVIGIPVLLAPVFGPTVGGLLTKLFDWRAIFTINLPIGVIVFILSLLTLHSRQQDIALGAEPSPATSRFDITGLAFSILGTISLVYGISNWSTNDFSSTNVWLFILIGALLLLAFVLTELRLSDPVMDIRLFRNYSFTVANVLTWVLSAFLFGSFFLLPAFFERVQNRDPLATGLILMAQGIGAVIGVALSGRLYNTVGPRPIIVTGLLLITLSGFGFLRLDANTPWQSLQAWLFVRGIGFGMGNIPLQTLALSQISNRAMARASSLTNVTRQIFAAVGISVLTTYLTHDAVTYFNPTKASFQNGPLKAAQQACVAHVGQNLQSVQQCVQQQAQAYVFQHTFTNALNDTFGLVLIGTLIAAGFALFIGRDPAVERVKAARANGEIIEASRPMIAGE